MTARDGGQLGQTYCCSLQSCSPYVAIWEDHRVSLSSAQCVLSHVFIYVSSTFALTSQYTFGYFFSMYINHSKEQQDFNILFVSSTSILKVTLLKKVKKKKNDEMIMDVADFQQVHCKNWRRRNVRENVYCHITCSTASVS